MMQPLLWMFAIVGVGAMLFGLVIMGLAALYFYRAYQIQRRMAQLIGAAAQKAVPLAEEVKADIVN